jgi:hypothetical protein
MASVHPGTSYHTKRTALTSNALTVIYTCGDQQELAFDVVGISVAATSANPDTCSIYINSGGVDWCVVFKGPVEADFPLQIEGLPIHLVPGEIIRAQATNAATNILHVHVSGLRTTRTAMATAVLKK